MSKHNIYRTGKLSDKKILDLFKAIEAEFGQVDANVHIGNLKIDYNSEENKKLFIKKHQQSIQKGEITTSLHKLTIKFRRGTSIDESNYECRQASPYFDEIIVVFGTERNNKIQCTPKPEEAIKCIDIIHKSITTVLLPSVEGGANNATDLLQALIEKQSEQYQDMITDLDLRRKDFDASVNLERNRMRKEADTQKARIDAENQEERNK